MGRVKKCPFLCKISLFKKIKKDINRKIWGEKAENKKDRILTNFMSLLFLEGRLFVRRFLIWDLSLSLSKINIELTFLLRKILLNIIKLFYALFFICVKRERERERVWPSRSKLLPDDDLSFFTGVEKIRTCLFIV